MNNLYKTLHKFEKQLQGAELSLQIPYNVSSGQTRMQFKVQLKTSNYIKLKIEQLNSTTKSIKIIKIHFSILNSKLITKSYQLDLLRR